jgi:hypothetical protein
MSFYRNFKNKEDLASCVIENVYKSSFKKYKSIMSENSSFNIKVKNLVKYKYKSSKGISKEFIDEILKSKYSQLKQEIDRLNKMSFIEVSNDFKKAQENEEIRQDLSLEFILFMLADINKKASDKELQKMYPSEEALILQLTKFFFYGILTNSDS